MPGLRVVGRGLYGLLQILSRLICEALLEVELCQRDARRGELRSLPNDRIELRKGLFLPRVRQERLDQTLLGGCVVRLLGQPHLVVARRLAELLSAGESLRRAPQRVEQR